MSVRVVGVSVALFMLAVGCSESGLSADIHAPESVDQALLNGSNAVDGQFPYAVSLRYDGVQDCSGVIIDGRHVLTAAHCVAGDLSRYELHAGTVSPPSDRPYRIEDAWLHPDWRAGSIANDVAVVRVDGDLTEVGEPALLATPEWMAGILPGHDVYVAGWGQVSEAWRDHPDMLQWGVLPYLDTAACAAFWSGHGFAVPEGTMCLDTTADTKVCKADSGSGAVIDAGGQWVVAGVMVMGSHCYETDAPDVATSVAYWLPWIQQTVADSYAVPAETASVDVTFGSQYFNVEPIDGGLWFDLNVPTTMRVNLTSSGYANPWIHLQTQEGWVYVDDDSAGNGNFHLSVVLQPGRHTVYVESGSGFGLEVMGSAAF